MLLVGWNSYFLKKCSESPFTRAQAGRHGKLSFCIIIISKCWSVLGWMTCDDPSGAWQCAAEKSVRWTRSGRRWRRSLKWRRCVRRNLLTKKTFVEVFGEDNTRPKHHHRLHIPDAALLLGFLPDTAPHEKKHRVMKSGELVDNQAKRLSDALALQKSLLPRLLVSTATMTNEFHLFKFELIGHTKPCSQQEQEFFQDAGLRKAPGVHVLSLTIWKGSVVFTCAGTGLVDACFAGPVAGYFLRVEELQHDATHSWGTAWKRCTGQNFYVLRLSMTTRIEMPVWQRSDGNLMICVH